jgi:hypothetical protein
MKLRVGGLEIEIGAGDMQQLLSGIWRTYASRSTGARQKLEVKIN